MLFHNWQEPHYNIKPAGITRGFQVEISAAWYQKFEVNLDTPYANYLTSFVVGEYVDIKQSYEGVLLPSFGYPDEAEAVADSVVRLPDMMKFYSEVTGVKYPHPSYSQVFVQEFPGWMANTAASTITENMVDDYRTHAAI